MNRKNFLPLLLFILINCLFIYKYADRLFPGAWLLSIGYGLASWGGLVVLNRIPIKFFTQKLVYFSLVLLVISAALIMYTIKLDTLNVDRWSVISVFWEAIFNGEFPYAAKSIHDNPPGPFPFYFVVALPFYLIGEIGLMTVLSILGLIGLYFHRGKSYKGTLLLVLLLLLSPAVWWEISTRSTIFTNMFLVLLYITWLENFKHTEIIYQLTAGIIGGFLLSTRGIVAVSYIAFFSFAYFRLKNWRSSLYQGFGIGIGFLATLLPFVFWNIELFSTYNPITLQAGFINWPLLIIIILTTIVIMLKTKTSFEFYRNLGIIITAVITAALIKSIFLYGWHAVIYANAFDISYFILALPFLARALFDIFATN